MCDAGETISHDLKVQNRPNVGGKFFIMKEDATISDISHGKLKSSHRDSGLSSLIICTDLYPLFTLKARPPRLGGL